jgi:hypothetical protein
MSRTGFRRTTGVIFTLVAFVLGVTATAALGWGGTQGSGEMNDYGTPQSSYPQQEEKGKDHGNKGQGKDHGNNNKEQGKDHGEQKKPPEENTSPPATPPAATTPPAAAAPPGTPVTPQSTTPLTPAGQSPPTSGTQKPPERVLVRTKPPAPEETTPLAPVAERRQLAETGLDPALIAFTGVVLLGGGAFLFRRSLARD